MIEEFEVTVPAPRGAETRTASVYLPESYDGKKRFPVLYMFDGQTAFFDERAPYGDSWRMGEELDRLGAELVVATVDCDAHERITEYSPFAFDCGDFHSEGKGGNYLDWFVGAFKPMIDGKYCTRPDRAHTYLAGSSMGGLMTVFGLCRYPDVFAGGASLSPSFWADPKASEQMIRAAKIGKAKLYLDYGEKELERHGARQREALSACIAALLEQKTELTFRLIRGGKHNEVCWRRQIPVFLRALGLI